MMKKQLGTFLLLSLSYGGDISNALAPTTAVNSIIGRGLRSSPSSTRPLKRKMPQRRTETKLDVLMDPSSSMDILCAPHESAMAAYTAASTAVAAGAASAATTITTTTTRGVGVPELPSFLMASSLNNPDVEAEVLIDMSHVVMDFTGLFASRNSGLARLCQTIVGRLLVLGADWLPDHIIHPEELAVQVFFLGISLSEILKTWLLAQEEGQKLN